jgi:DNA-binding FadR family transcriptional regulator
MTKNAGESRRADGREAAAAEALPDVTTRGPVSFDESGSHIAPLGRTPQLPSRVAAAIATEIMEGRLADGAKLPTEQVLAAKFGVSRSVVREAIARLRSDGMVRSRQGVGAFVVRERDSATLRIDADLMSDRFVFRNVFELRAILEIRAAGLAARRGTPEQLAAVSEAMMRMRHASNWLVEGVPADLEFHRLVAAASGNAYMAMMVGFLSGQMRESIMFMRENQSDVAGAMIGTNIAEHAAIHDAVVGRDPDRAITAMRTHIMNAARRLGYDLGDGVSL